MTKYRNGLVVILSVFILTAIGIGASIIYSDYIYNPTGFSYTLMVDSSAEPGYDDLDAAEADASFLRGLDDWAKTNRATILLINPVSAGCGYAAYSDWIKDVLKIESVQTMGTGIYIEDNAAIRDAYVSGDIFMPGAAGLKITGVYSAQDVPSVIKSAGFLYPLSIGAAAFGTYFTDAANIDELIQFFNDNGYSAMVSGGDKSLSAGGLIRKLITDGFMSRAVLFAMLGLIFCFIYDVLLLYRDNTRLVFVHHIFGLSRRRIFLRTVILMTGSVAVAALLFGTVLASGLTYLGPEDQRHIFKAVISIYAVLAACVYGIGYFRLMHQLSLRGA